MRDTTNQQYRPTPAIHPLSETQRRLVTLMRNIRFGRIENLPVANGEPVFSRMPTVVREIKFGCAENQSTDLPADGGGHPVYGCAMCRVHYLRAPEVIPPAGEVVRQAEYWKRWYNTPLGAGRVEEFVNNWQRMVGNP